MPDSGPSFSHDPSDPIFAISYTRGSGNAHHATVQSVRKLFRRLEVALPTLVETQTGQEIGFLDRDAMTGGQHPWPAKVRRIYARSQVLVALLQPNYPNSSWCEQEWKTFAGRKAFDRRTGAPAENLSILPVLWAPVDMEAMPGYIKEVQLFVPTRIMRSNAERHYLEEGLIGLLELYPEEFKQVTHRLATTIRDCLNQTWTEPVQGGAALEEVG